MNRSAPLKQRLRELLESGDLEAIARLASRERRVLGALVPLTYDPEAEMCWRAIEATGQAADAVAEADPAAVLEHLRRLCWLMTEESGAICWRAPEAMAEIVVRRPDLCAAFVPILAHLLEEMAAEDLAHFGEGILWAIGRLGSLAAPEMPQLAPRAAAWLRHPDPQLRGTAAWALGRTAHGDQLRAIPELTRDSARVRLRQDGVWLETTVADLAREALEPRSEPLPAGG